MVGNTSHFIVDLNKIPEKDNSYIFYFDTNFFINTLTSLAPYRKQYHSYYQACHQFFERIDPVKRRNKDILCYTASFTLCELFWFVIKHNIITIMKEKGIKEDISPENFYKRDPAIIHKSFDTIDNIKKDLDAYPIYIIEPLNNTSAETIRLIREYDLLPADAYHIAIAKDNGINKIISLDEDFGRPAFSGEFTLYTSNHKLLHPNQ